MFDKFDNAQPNIIFLREFRIANDIDITQIILLKTCWKRLKNFQIYILDERFPSKKRFLIRIVTISVYRNWNFIRRNFIDFKCTHSEYQQNMLKTMTRYRDLIEEQEICESMLTSALMWILYSNSEKSTFKRKLVSHLFEKSFQDMACIKKSVLKVQASAINSC